MAERPEKGLTPFRRNVVTLSCPQCGCQRGYLLSTGKRWGQDVVKFACDNCGTQWSIASEANGADTAYEHNACLYCGSTSTVIVSSPATKNGVKVRYHRCRTCRASFSTVEQR